MAWLEPQLCWAVIPCLASPEHPAPAAFLGESCPMLPQKCHTEEEEGSRAWGSLQSKVWPKPADVIWPLAMQQLRMSLKSSGSCVGCAAGRAAGADSRAGGEGASWVGDSSRGVRALLQEHTHPQGPCIRAGVSEQQGALAEGKSSWNPDQAREVLLGV